MCDKLTAYRNFKRAALWEPMVRAYRSIPLAAITALA